MISDDNDNFCFLERCWITVRWSVLQIIFFYVPLWCSFLFNFFVYLITGYKIFKAFRKLKNIKTPEGKKLDKKRKIAYMRAVSGYLGTIVCDCVCNLFDIFSLTEFWFEFIWTHMFFSSGVLFDVDLGKYQQSTKLGWPLHALYLLQLFLFHFSNSLCCDSI